MSMSIVSFVLFFFKQKTAYELRISDWSSDVCSSDLHARIEGLGFAAQGDAPGISGLSGVLDGDAEGLSFKFDPQATLRFDWPSGFGTPHDVHLTGRVAGWREDAGWRIATPALRIDEIGRAHV